MPSGPAALAALDATSRNPRSAPDESTLRVAVYLR